MRKEEEIAAAERAKDEFFARERARQKELQNDPDVRWLLTYWIYSAGGGLCGKDHSKLNNGVAPMDWPGWKDWAAPFNRECACCLIGSSKTRALRMLESGEAFDLTRGVPLKLEDR